MKIKEEWKQSNGKYKCPECSKEYTKSGIGSHMWRIHGNGQEFKPISIAIKNGYMSWNKGLTADTDKRIQNQGKSFSQNIKNGKTIPWQKGKQLSDDHKKAISNGMKKAHKENRAHNIGSSRHNNKPSYPESFFMKVIENEFNDKNYIRELPFKRYALDFAWPDKKLCIEIDGQQHDRFDEYKARDIRKDKALVVEGWKVLRIKWVDMYHKPQKYINLANDFIHKPESHLQIFIYETIIKNSPKYIPIKITNPRSYTSTKVIKQGKIPSGKKVMSYTEAKVIKEQKIIQELINSTIDFTKLGWGEKAGKIIGISGNGSRRWMKSKMPDFLEKCYQR